MGASQGSVAERYDVATDTSDLGLRDGRCDADVLLAAGYATARNTRGALALSLYRIRATGHRNGLLQIANAAEGWLVDRRPPGGGKPMRLAEARKLGWSVLLWWLDGVCPHCQGRRYELVPGTQVVSDNLCHVCDGSGRPPLASRVRREHAEPAAWLAAELDRMMSFVLADMAKRLRNEL